MRMSVATHDGAVLWPPAPIKATAPAAASSATPATATAAAAPAATAPAKAAVATPAPKHSGGGHGHGKKHGNAAPALSPEAAKSASFQAALRAALSITGGSVSLLALGAAAPPIAVINTLSVFSLASMVGYSAVWGVTPALHSPLMSVTNAISGLTAVGGLAMMGGGAVPQTGPQALGAIAAFVSAVNIGGGFVMTHRSE